MASLHGPTVGDENTEHDMISWHMGWGYEKLSLIYKFQGWSDEPFKCSISELRRLAPTRLPGAAQTSKSCVAFLPLNEHCKK